nr:immunoglobulin light chain junction region [Macaca mulatta]MOV62268.1 immunoglobulin light chain junction region [Macaca mulatta]MOV62389.1 immunoglobulin light chain junction region [Macaca mulatta]MOV62399.1 immunoglobulin light chain junction region [Macaca mulatta]MOV62732.1 immunoglobulin light chain junction region [Macaca mulatta]
CQQHNTYPYSF